MEPGPSAGHSAACSGGMMSVRRRIASFTIDAVLVDVQRVEQMREPGVGRRRVRPGGQSGVQVEGGLFGRRRSQFALILQLGAQQGIVS